MYFTVRRLRPPGNNILVGFIIGRAMAGWLVAATAAVSLRPDGIKTQSSVTSTEERGGTIRGIKHNITSTQPSGVFGSWQNGRLRFMETSNI